MKRQKTIYYDGKLISNTTILQTQHYAVDIKIRCIKLFIVSLFRVVADVSCSPKHQKSPQKTNPVPLILEEMALNHPVLVRWSSFILRHHVQFHRT